MLFFSIYKQQCCVSVSYSSALDSRSIWIEA